MGYLHDRQLAQHRVELKIRESGHCAPRLLISASAECADPRPWVTSKIFLAALFAAQRQALVELRNEGEISSDVMRRIERELDLEESRLEV